MKVDNGEFIMEILAVFFIGVTVALVIVGTMLHRAAKAEKDRQ